MAHGLRIGVDARHLISKPTGIGNYIAGILQEITQVDKDVELILYSHRPVHIDLAAANVHFIIEKNPIFSRFGAFLWWHLIASKYIRKDRLDILWCAGGFLPKGVGSIKTLTTVYDFVHRVSPQSMTWKNYFLYRIFHDHGLKRSTYLSTISQGTNQRMKKYVGRGAEIINLPLINKIYDRGLFQTDKSIADKVDHYTILSVATFEPRKNLISLICAINNVRSRLNRDIRLKLIGKNGWKTNNFLPLLEKNKAWITVLGYLPIEQMPHQYRSCDLFCFPSIYEGYGMPIREARNCGALVLTTDSPEMREAGDDSVIYADPSIQGLECALLACIEKNKDSGKPAPKQQYWPKTGNKIVFSEKIRELLKN
jgi:glycosyltransferase involved in cell wall biosynthesis